MSDKLSNPKRSSPDRGLIARQALCYVTWTCVNGGLVKSFSQSQMPVASALTYTALMPESAHSQPQARGCTPVGVIGFDEMNRAVGFSQTVSDEGNNPPAP